MGRPQRSTGTLRSTADRSPRPSRVTSSSSRPRTTGRGSRVVSPTLKRLSSLRTEWDKALAKAREGEPEVSPPRDVVPLGKLDDLESLAAKKTSNDGSAPNGSSIGLLLEHRGASCLLSGDGFGKVLAEGLTGLAAARGVEAIEVDAFKLPHHGSQANVASALIEAAPARHYVVSSNGDTFNHPDDVAIARVLVGGPQGATLWFNYENDRTRRWADPELRERFGHKVKFPETPAAGAVLELPARASRVGDERAPPLADCRWPLVVPILQTTVGPRMHELAIAESVVSSVLERTGDRHVSVVRLRIGRLAGVVPDALDLLLRARHRRHPPRGSDSLEIAEEHGRAHCRTCGTDFDLARRLPAV